MVEPLAFLFPAADDGFPFERTALRGDHGGLPFFEAAVVVQHHPIARAAGFVRVRAVGKERGVVAKAAMRMENREPSLAGGIEAPWSDGVKLAGGGFFAIFAIDVEQLLDGRFIGGVDVRGGFQILQ